MRLISEIDGVFVLSDLASFLNFAPVGDIFRDPSLDRRPPVNPPQQRLREGVVTSSPSLDGGKVGPQPRGDVPQRYQILNPDTRGRVHTIRCGRIF